MAYRAKNRRTLAKPSRIELAEIAILQDKKPGDGCNKFTINNFHNGDKAQKAWKRFGAEIMKDWPNKNTRPHCWYIFECQVKPPFEISPDFPQYWAAMPWKIPSEAKQKKFLDSLKK